MSLDARYIFHYECQDYLPPTPMELDEKFLIGEYGGKFVELDWEYDIFWDKPKHTLLREDLEKLHADQILERTDGDFWEDVTPKRK